MGKLFETVDWIDLTLLLVIGVIGLFILLSINQTLFVQQLGIFILAVIAGWLVSRVDSVLLVWIAPFGYIASILFLALSYLGPAIRGTTRWILVAGVGLQPSELVKPILLLAFAWGAHVFSVRTVKGFLLQVALFSIPFFLVLRQPDLGTSIVYAVTWLSMMVAAGFPLRFVIMGALVATTLVPFGWSRLHEYQQARITTFVSPGTDPKGAGYNAIQAMIAVGSGQLFGRGLGRGTQSHLRFLPEYHTDFIFATLVEELGFFGGFILLLAYGALLWRILRPLVAGVIVHLIPFVVSTGLFAMILTQVVVSVGMNMGLVPITGITLPLVSYGGSSVLSLSVSFGLLWALRESDRTGRIV